MFEKLMLIKHIARTNYATVKRIFVLFITRFMPLLLVSSQTSFNRTEIVTRFKLNK